MARLAAELAVVVLGVTIALWADGWVAERSDRAIETARLEALYDNIVGTLAELDMARDGAAGAAAALRKLISFRPGDQPNEEVEQLLRYGLLYGTSFHPELNVYDDLKNSGELALLTNPEIRQSLATMDVRLEIVEYARVDLMRVQQLNVDPYMIENLNLRSLFGPITGLPDTPENSKLDLEFMSDVKFRNVVLFKLDLVTFLEGTFKSADIALVAVRQSIASQLTTQPQ